MRGGPSPHIGADFRNQLERGVGRDAVDLCQIDAPGEMVERRPNLEGGVGGPRLSRHPWRGQRCGRRGQLGGQLLDVRGDGPIAIHELRLTRIEEFQILSEREEMLRAVMTGQCCDDLGRRRPTPTVAVLRELRRVALAPHNVTQNAKASQSGDVTDHEWQLEIHLDQGFLHALDVHRGGFDEGLSVADIGP
jgi:hypothetical protein